MFDLPEEKKGSEYFILVKGVLDSKWADWFGGLTITTNEKGETLLVGSIADQAALHGLLSKIRDLGLTLLSVQLIAEIERERSSADS